MSKQVLDTGQALKTLRKLAGLTLDEVSQRTGTAPAYLSKVENGRLLPANSYVAKITAALSREINESNIAA